MTRVAQSALYRQDQETQQAGRIARLREGAPLLAELFRLGYAVNALEELELTRESYESAIPTLVRWLPRVRNRDLKVSLLLALCVKGDLPDLSDALIKEFETHEDPGVRSLAADALVGVASASDLNVIMRLFKDRQYGWERGALARILADSGDVLAFATLVEALGEEELQINVLEALGRMRSRAGAAYDAVERLVSSPRSDVRSVAHQTLKRLRMPESRRRPSRNG